MKLLGSTKSKTTKNKNRENVPNLEITEIVSLHCNIYHWNQRVNLRKRNTLIKERILNNHLFNW